MASIPVDAYTPLKEYFRSIEKTFEETLTSKAKTDIWEVLRNAFITLVVFSVIPVLPYVGWRLLRLHVFGLYGIAFSLPSFWIWWSLCVGVYALALVFLSRLVSRRKKAKQETWLSRPQLRFALSYAVVNEIEKFQTNRLQKPIAKAAEYEGELWQSLRELLISPFGRIALPPDMEESRLTSLNEVDFLSRTFPWFKLEEKARKIFDALRGFHSKIQDRIRDKKDLNDVSQCLLYLSAYLYTQIPELQPNPSEKGATFAQWGVEQLATFADSVARFPAYSSEEGRVAKKELIKKSVASRVAAVTGIFSHDNIFVCFLSWLVCLSVLVSIGTWIMLRTFPSLKMDSVLVSTIVATPIVGAATLVAIARQRQP